jgi:hypothetical protein
MYEPHEQLRRPLGSALLSASGNSPLWRETDVLLDTMAATELRQLVRDKDVSPVELTKKALGRAEATQKTLNAFFVLMPESALAAARAAEDAVMSGFIRRWAATDAAAYEGRRLRQGLLDKSNTASGVWADTAYRSAANETFLNKNGFVSHIHRKKPKGRAMPETMRRGR